MMIAHASEIVARRRKLFRFDQNTVNRGSDAIERFASFWPVCLQSMTAAIQQSC